MPRWSPNSNSNSNNYIDPRKLGPYNIHPNSTNHPKHDKAYINMNARKKSINQMVRMSPGTRFSLGALRRSQINPNVPYGMSPALTPFSRGRTRGARTPSSNLSSFNWNSESNQSSNLSSIPWDGESSFEPIDSLASSLSSITLQNSNSNSNNSGYNSNSNGILSNLSSNFGSRRGSFSSKKSTRPLFNAGPNWNRNNNGNFPFLGYRRFEKGTMSKGSKRSKSKTKRKNKTD